uniref:Uncharacterized protein n=1 Tax=Anguilla anguilla TaxID=7936 RepID=A0A0E9U302_ANGAN
MAPSSTPSWANPTPARSTKGFRSL